MAPRRSATILAAAMTTVTLFYLLLVVQATDSVVHFRGGVSTVTTLTSSTLSTDTSDDPPPPTSSPSSPRPKNVLFVIFDDLRNIQQAFGAEDGQAYTPNTNQLAADGLTLERAYCQQAVCGPSRASLLSGRRPDETQMWNFVGGFRQTPGADKWNTMPEWFKKRGYYVAGCGKLFHPGDPANFDPQSWTEPECVKAFPYHGQGKCPYKTPSHQSPCPVDPKQYPSHVNPDDLTLANAKQFMANAVASKKPFWLGVGFVKPHMPHVFPAKYAKAVPQPDNITLPENRYMSDPSKGAKMNWDDGAEGEPELKDFMTPFPNATIQTYRHAYYAAAAYSDDLFGQLRGMLVDHGLENDTIIALTADHGWGLGEHNHWVKYTNWETDARVPTIIHVPWLPASKGARTKALVEHVDLYPTLAELAGVPVDQKEGVAGVSYAHLFETPTNTHKEAAFTQYPRCCKKNCDNVDNPANHQRCASVKKENFKFMGYSMRTDEYRYTEWVKWNGTSLKPLWEHKPLFNELYSHAGNDNGRWTYERFENQNVAAIFPEVAGNLSAQLRAFFKDN